MREHEKKKKALERSKIEWNKKVNKENEKKKVKSRS